MKTPPPVTRPRPHVVVICTDQQRYDSLGCTGDPHAVTPRLDELAADAETCVFDRHFTAATVCMPSRSTLMTGCYPSVHGVWTNGIALPRGERVRLTELQQEKSKPGSPLHGRSPSHLPTMADAFGAAGYRTASVGKLHLAPTQSHRELGHLESQDRWNHDPAMAQWHGPLYGFEHVDLSLDHGGVLNGHYRHWLKREQPGVAERIEASAQQPKPTSLGDLYPLDCPVEAYSTSWAADRACDVIDPQGDDRPLMMWLGIPDPHHPFTPPAEIAARFADHPVRPPSLSHPHDPTQTAWGTGAKPMVSPQETRMVRRHTHAMNNLIDSAVGQVIDRLKARGMWDNTILVFTSDHGDYLGDYGLIRKTDRASRVLNHTPLLIRAPGGGLPARCPTAVSNADVMPTLCDFAGIDAPRVVQGEPLSAVVGEGRQRPVMAMSATGNVGETNLSLFDDHSRLTWYPQQDTVEFFDHTADPMEWDNLAEASAHRGRADAQLTRLKDSFAQATVPRRGRVASW